jgi:hypothetical protein
MRWLDDWAWRRYRQSYAKVLASRDDARGLAAFFTRSLPRYNELPRVHASGVFKRRDHEIPTSCSSDQATLAWAAIQAGAMEFWVDNEESGKKFVVYVVEVARDDSE